MEGLRLRVKDIDFSLGEILVRDGKGEKDRRTMLPASLQPALKEQLEKAAALHRQDLAEGYGRVYLPYALARKYPKAAFDWCWQYVFPAEERSREPRSGQWMRHHVYERSIQRAFREAKGFPLPAEGGAVYYST